MNAAQEWMQLLMTAGNQSPMPTYMANLTTTFPRHSTGCGKSEVSRADKCIAGRWKLMTEYILSKFLVLLMKCGHKIHKYVAIDARSQIFYYVSVPWGNEKM